MTRAGGTGSDHPVDHQEIRAVMGQLELKYCIKSVVVGY